ncbi:MAG: histidinol-phosphate aminotransferase family protein [Candidatus Omnitrophica bacterium]|nr:histidinol-phosphate aminotransferase family protein [Candidatus Omnitrophota bacterium]
MTDVKACIESLVRIQPDNEARESCLRLDLNENVGGLPEDFVRGVLSRVDAEYLATYPKYRRLREQIAGLHNLNANNISLGNGSDGSIKYLYESYIAAGDRVLLTDPTFAMYQVYGDMFEARTVSVPYNADFTFPMESFKCALTDNIKLAVLVNPNNPTGTALNRKDMESIVKQARDHNVMLLVDEAYHYFCDDTAMPLITKYPNLIVLRTFSKLCALAATRIGYAAGPADIIGNIEKVKPTYDVNGLGVLFAQALLDQPEIIEQLIQKFQKARDHLQQRLSAAGIPFRAGNANFTLIDVGQNAAEVLDKLREKKILVGGGFAQPNLANYIRVTIGDISAMDIFVNTLLPILRKDNHE